jgi:hypothetical protein
MGRRNQTNFFCELFRFDLIRFEQICSVENEHKYTCYQIANVFYVFKYRVIVLVVHWTLLPDSFLKDVTAELLQWSLSIIIRNQEDSSWELVIV